MGLGLWVVLLGWEVISRRLRRLHRFITGEWGGRYDECGLREDKKMGRQEGRGGAIWGTDVPGYMATAVAPSRCTAYCGLLADYSALGRRGVVGFGLLGFCYGKFYKENFHLIYIIRWD